MFELKIGKSAVVEQEENKELKKEDKCTFLFLKRLLEGVAELMKRIEIKATPEGIYIQVIDPMQVSMTDVFLKSTAFENFRCDKAVSLKVNLTVLLKMLKSLPVTEASSVLLSANDEATKLQIACEEGRTSYKHSLDLLSFDSHGHDFPSMEYEASMTLPAHEFLKMIKTIGGFGETLRITAMPDRGFVFTQESEVGTSEVLFPLTENNENNDKKETEEEKEKKTIVSVMSATQIAVPYKYVAIFGKFSLLGGTISIQIASDVPVFIVSRFKFGHLSYYIAPRNESD